MKPEGNQEKNHRKQMQDSEKAENNHRGENLRAAIVLDRLNSLRSLPEIAFPGASWLRVFNSGLTY